MGLQAGPELRKDGYHLLILGLVVFLPIAWVFLSAFAGLESPKSREGAAFSLIAQLSQSAKAYELDYFAYPPGDGNGSKGLASCLQKRTKKQFEYFEFNSDMLDQGNLVNPVWGKEGEPPKNWIHYRHPGIHNPKSFDLWCADLNGQPDGINNWK